MNRDEITRAAYAVALQTPCRHRRDEEPRCRQKLIMTAPGILDTFETDEEVGVYQSDVRFGE
jgi:hypothetical protein